ncbi:MAG: PEGA domain-containing protein, partial [Deltaproteobacteria bacterium]|nr:PEGA domain-containing protein [Deltaproteobacteria bacterium]
GTLDITSQPKGADIYVDREHRGVTPVELKGLNLNEPTRFEVRKRGYRSVTHKVLWHGHTYHKVSIALKRSR